MSSFSYYYCSPIYDPSFIVCAILCLLAQGCCNDIKNPSCFLSCDQYSPSTGLAGVSCGTKDDCRVNYELFVAKSPNTGQAGVTCRNTSNGFFNGPPINAVCDQGDDSLDSFSEFSDPGGRFGLRPRVFTVLIYPALFNQMLRAAMVVLNKFRPK